MGANINGYYNSVIGLGALAINKFGINNTATGYYSGRNSLGNYNIYIGANKNMSNFFML